MPNRYAPAPSLLPIVHVRQSTHAPQLQALKDLHCDAPLFLILLATPFLIKTQTLTLLAALEPPEVQPNLPVLRTRPSKAVCIVSAAGELQQKPNFAAINRRLRARRRRIVVFK